eukprot:scaffold54927_cov31-Tisochrysis_lutea.AAC.2
MQRPPRDHRQVRRRLELTLATLSTMHVLPGTRLGRTLHAGPKLELTFADILGLSPPSLLSPCLSPCPFWPPPPLSTSPQPILSLPSSPFNSLPSPSPVKAFHLAPSRCCMARCGALART